MGKLVFSQKKLFFFSDKMQKRVSLRNEDENQSRHNFSYDSTAIGISNMLCVTKHQFNLGPFMFDLTLIWVCRVSFAMPLRWNRHAGKLFRHMHGIPLLRFIIRLPKRATKITQNKQRKSTIFFQGCEDIYTNTYISSICFIESKRLRLFFIITASICYVGTQQTELTQLLSLPLILLLLPNSKLI